MTAKQPGLVAQCSMAYRRMILAARINNKAAYDAAKAEYVRLVRLVEGNK